MFIQVNTYSRKEFDSLGYNELNVHTSKDYFICINASGGIHNEPYFNLDHDNVLNMYFDDVLQDTIKYYGPTDSEYEFFAKACTVTQIKELYNFISKISDNSILHIYCTKGRSRSIAVAKYVNEYINHIDYTVEGYNQLVYDQLCLISK